MEYIITFKNTNSAIKAEQCLLEKKLHVGVLPLPSQISAGCGLCLKVGAAEIAPALSDLTEKNINGIRLFARSEENKRLIYTQVNLKDGRI